jgi:hypothetical protein
VLRITLRTPRDAIDADLQNRITEEVEGVFRLWQLLVHRPFKVDAVSVRQRHSDGTRSISVSAAGGELVSLVDQCDFVVHDASGAVVQDTNAQRIKQQTDFIDAVVPKLPNSPTLSALLASYNTAVDDGANELMHLYEIRDALAKHYGGDREARKKLRISKKEWKRLGILANTAPLKEGRHRGKHSALRRATAAELDEARKIVRGWIKAFAGQL